MVSESFLSQTLKKLAGLFYVLLVVFLANYYRKVILLEIGNSSLQKLREKNYKLNNSEIKYTYSR